MNFTFSLLRIKDLYMFRALLAHPQEATNNGTRYIACVLYQLAASGLKWNFNPGAHARNIPSAACAETPENEQVILETCRGP
jgi:hypothetical protein